MQKKVKTAGRGGSIGTFVAPNGHFHEKETHDPSENEWFAKKKYSIEMGGPFTNNLNFVEFFTNHRGHGRSGWQTFDSGLFNVTPTLFFRESYTRRLYRLVLQNNTETYLRPKQDPFKTQNSPGLGRD